MKSMLTTRLFYFFPFFNSIVKELFNWEVNYVKSFLAFNQNAVSNFLYLLSSNGFSFLLVFGVLGTILLLLKEEYDIAARDEHGVI